MNDNYLFTYHSVPEDDRCYWEEYAKAVPLFGGGDKVWKGAAACFEQVLTDKNFNVLSVFTELYPPDGCHTELVQVAVYYDWTKLERLWARAKTELLWIQLLLVMPINVSVVMNGYVSQLPESGSFNPM